MKFDPDKLRHPVAARAVALVGVPCFVGEAFDLASRGSGVDAAQAARIRTLLTTLHEALGAARAPQQMRTAYADGVDAILEMFDFAIAEQALKAAGGNIVDFPVSGARH